MRSLPEQTCLWLVKQLFYNKVQQGSSTISQSASATTTNMFSVFNSRIFKPVKWSPAPVVTMPQELAAFYSRISSARGNGRWPHQQIRVEHLGSRSDQSARSTAITVICPVYNSTGQLRFLSIQSFTPTTARSAKDASRLWGSNC